jgi:germination protein M
MKLVVPALSILLAGLVGFSVASCGSGGAEAVGSVPSLPGNAAATVDRTTSTVMSEPEPDSTTSEAAAKRVVVELWFTEGETLFLRKVSAESPGPRVGSQAVTMLLAGPGEDEEELATAIPAETKLLGLSIDGGVATVDLTSEFESGGGSLSMRMRIAQIVYTLTQFPTVDSVLFELDGEPVEAIGGEGVIVDQPLRRKDYADLLPAIVVATPFVEQAVGSPIRVSGTANVFEANVTVRILDAHGREIARTFTTATCGTGCRGTFSVDVPYSVNEDQSGWVVVSDDDAAGVGRPPHEVKIPVELGV